MEQKMISVNFDAVKQKAVETVADAASSAKTRLVSAGGSVRARVAAQRNKAVSKVLGKSIEVTERQLDRLKKVHKGLAQA